jgi:dolichyl-phosphate beta-glucosyltransferase
MVGFHLVVKWIGGITAINDTQCGFKLFTRDAGILDQVLLVYFNGIGLLLFEPLHIERWAFDVELLWIAQKNCIPISEVPVWQLNDSRFLFVLTCQVEWTEVAGSHLEEEDTRIVSVKMFFDLLRFRLSYELGLWEIAKI